MIPNSFYYYLCRHTSTSQTYLTAIPKATSKGYDLLLQQPQEDTSSQLWHLQSADLQGVYYIHHCSTGLALQVGKENGFDLHHHKNRVAQKFKFNLIAAEKQEYVVSEYGKDQVLFVRDGVLVHDSKTGGDKVLWTLKRAKKSPSLDCSSIIQNQRSGYFLDVADNAQKQQNIMIQCSLSGMFSQRWKFDKIKDFYLIRNLKSQLVASVKGNKSKDGATIIQLKQDQINHKYQLWSIQPRGHRLYSIRLASQQDLFLGVTDYTSDKAHIQLVKEGNKHLWQIIGGAVL